MQRVLNYEELHATMCESCILSLSLVMSHVVVSFIFGIRAWNFRGLAGDEPRSHHQSVVEICVLAQKVGLGVCAFSFPEHCDGEALPGLGWVVGGPGQA